VTLETLVQNPLLFGVIGGVVAAAMLVTELMGHRIFTLQLTSECAVPLWILFAIYAALQLMVWRARDRAMELTEKEVATWGGKLEVVTPTILEMFGEQKKSVREIAIVLRERHGIPQDITVRYIIALGRHLREHRQDTPHQSAPTPPAE
jgi:hypothetical protein